MVKQSISAGRTVYSTGGQMQDTVCAGVRLCTCPREKRGVAVWARPVRHHHTAPVWHGPHAETGNRPGVCVCSHTAERARRCATGSLGQLLAHGGGGGGGGGSKVGVVVDRAALYWRGKTGWKVAYGGGTVYVPGRLESAVFGSPTLNKNGQYKPGPVLTVRCFPSADNPSRERQAPTIVIRLSEIPFVPVVVASLLRFGS